MTYSFGLVREALEFLGFELRSVDDDIFVYFYHPMNGKSVIIDTDYELPDSYISDKVESVGLSYSYFLALTRSITAKKIIVEKR